MCILETERVSVLWDDSEWEKDDRLLFKPFQAVINWIYFLNATR
jgi:hypothetical protein